ncbi:hypothetical protein AAH443_05870 [Klebsiella quasipneumoniae subsp. similipneumoniae]
MRGSLNPALCYPQLLVVILVVLTERQFRFSLHISQLLAKAIPVRETLFAVPDDFTMFRMNSVHTPVDGR